MSSTNQTPAQQRLSDLKVSGYLMTLQTGVFCVFSTPGQQQPSAAGLPGVRISQSPAGNAGNVEIITFDSEGWLRTVNGAALVRVHQGPAQVLVTIYQEMNSQHEAPRLQVVQLSAQADAAVTLPVAAAAGAPQAEQKASSGADKKDQPPAEIGAHIQRQGDVAVPMGEWMGTPGSRAWIEGFGIAPASVISVADIEYQAVLGKGWLSPWVEGGQYCGSRGMALPILGLCVRLKGQAAKKFECRITATFTDGTEIGPVSGETPVEAESLAPLEAFFIEIVPRGAAGKKAKTLKAPSKPEKVEASAELEALLDEDDDSDLFEADDFDLFIEEDSADEPEEDEEPRAGSGSSRKTAASSKKRKAEEASPPTKAAAGKSRASARGRKSGSRR